MSAEEMTEEEKILESKKNRVIELTAGNERSYLELRQATAGRASIDTSDMRRELFIETLTKLGIITEEQRLNFEIAFQEKVEEALTNAWTQIREAQKPKLHVAKKPSKLILPGG